MQDYAEQAERLFREFARRHNLSIEKIDEPNVELLMSVPVQTGLHFEITLCCQNGDELNIGVENFWSTFFPFEKVQATVDQTLDGLVTGACSILTIKQFGRPVRGLLQRQHGEAWETVATHITGIKVPFVRTTETRRSNEPSMPLTR